VQNWVRFFNSGIWPHLTAAERNTLTTFAALTRQRMPSMWEPLATLAQRLAAGPEHTPAQPGGTAVSEDDHQAMLAYLRAGGPLFTPGKP
jgi:hypothetical protein